ncbi:hypothetical protein HOLleu_11732 [Holothuria leucospilota]|uniref:Peptidase A2 domain-containing protein n=1 Tax=Holothuria leucospilota TaxID=206669 RepID=A0A9Q1CGK3_HOLLE|nr:hypothetical protein HOLleu_11732 [Holothuria leucospilota]
MKQLPTENVEDFMAKCRIQADKCKFSTAESEQRLIEQLILGTAHKKVQEKLLGEDETLTVDKAMNIPRTCEATKAHVEAFTSATVSVDFINRKGQNKNLGSRSKADSQTKCRKCNLKYPHKGKCPAEGSTCNYCQKPNHWEAACRQKKRDNQGKHNRNRPRNRSRSRRERSSSRNQAEFREDRNRNIDMISLSRVDSSSDIEQDFESLSFDSITIRNMSNVKSNQESEASASIGIKVDGKPPTLRVKIDTGAEGNVIPMHVIKNFYPEFVNKTGKPLSKIAKPCDTRVTAYNGGTIPHYGTCTISCSYNNKHISTDFYIAEVQGPAILGLRDSIQLK